MRRIGLLSVAAGLVLCTVAAWQIGHVRGGSQAIAEFVADRPAFYQLGCDGSPPREPVAFRTRELLQSEYGVRIETIGGIGPSKYQGDFVRSYDSVMLWLLQRRHGSDFLESLEKRAKADVFNREIELVGRIQLSSRNLTVAPGTHYRITGSEKALSLAEPWDGQVVRVRGMVLDIRRSEWRNWGYASIEIERIQAEPGTAQPASDTAIPRAAAPVV
jgi:hypothetical protein